MFQKVPIIAFVLSFLLIFLFFPVRANENPEHNENSLQIEDSEHHDTMSEESFQPGAFIMEHIGDSHEWHICTIGETHVTIPLPVILFSENLGFHVFMSSRFHHGHSSHEGFMISHEKVTKGKIIEVDEHNQPVLDEADQVVKPWDFSITKNVLSLFVSILLIVLIFKKVAKGYRINEGKSPKGIQSVLEPLILFVRDDIAIPAIGAKKYMKYIPFLLTIFFFIFINNLLGLVPLFPGGANLTGNIAIAMVLALFTFVITLISGNKNYWTHIFWPPVPIALKLPLMIIIEVIGVFIKPFVLMVRLFANITAGHIIVLGFFSLIFIFGQMSLGGGYGISIVSLIFSVFMSLLELLVAFIQAYVFTLLSALYFGMATEEHH